METRDVRAGREVILNIADRATAIEAVAELVWNGLDAEADTVEIALDASDGLGAPNELVVRDNGHGMTYKDSIKHFTVHGDSWKRVERFSPEEHRPMHGKQGRGRFLTYSIAERATWTTVASNGEGREQTTIRGSIHAPEQFTFDGPTPTEDPTGTSVALKLTQTQKVAKLADDDASLRLIARLAHTLLALPNATVVFTGERLDPTPHIARQEELPITADPEHLQGHPAPTLRVVEWSRKMNERKIFLCDEHGAVLTEYTPRLSSVTPFEWSAYLLWEGFSAEATLADLHVPEIRFQPLLAAAERTLRDYLDSRLEQEKMRLLTEWKREGVYPYRGEPQSKTEEVERSLFDIVAVVASSGIPTNRRQKQFSLTLLREAVRTAPETVPDTLQAVLDLNEEQREKFQELLTLIVR